uniref:guanylate cyclase n=1 Tax=Meloidogyne javanica TaxID=6303 RepID=A0A915NCQ4_MELJA
TNSPNILPLQLKIGLLFANSTQALRLLFGFAQSAPAINLAIKRARNESLIDNINFTFTWLNCNCDTSLAAGYTNKLFLDENVDAIIGPPCVTAALVAGYDASFYNFPMFLWGATVAADLFDQNVYPTVTNINSNTKIRNFLLAATDMGLVENNDYVLIIPLLRNQGMLQMVSIGRNGSKYDGFWKDTNSTNDGRDADALKAARRSIIIDLENRSNAQIDSFMSKMYAEFGQPPFNCSDSCMGGPEDQNPSSFSRSLHDATYAYLRALNNTMEKFGYITKEMARNGTLITNMSRETGNVIFDQQGNRQPIFYVTMLDASDQPQVVMEINFVPNNTNLKKRYTDESTIWINSNGKRPLYKPICGYTGTDCPPDMTTYIIIAIGLVVLIVLSFTFGIGYAIREKKKEKRRLTKECIIPFIELRNLKEIKNNDGSNIEINKNAPILYGIWKYCQRGSLKDLIAKEQYVGDSFVMFTLMRDIASGLIALHGSFVGAHGMLSSENCLINDRWQVKISDFGLNMIRESQPMSKRKLLWTAPELLRENNRKGTKEGDVYSFAIICCELVNRETVWNGVEREDDVD